jgi:hypothetical protein
MLLSLAAKPFSGPMPAESKPRIERHKAEELRFGDFYYFPNIDAHRAVDHLQLVNKRNIDAAEDVFQ